MEALAFVAAGVLVLGLVVWAGTRIVTADRSKSGGASDALGNFIDVFDPGQARADRYLKQKQNQGQVVPSPDDEDPPMTIDAARMRVTIRKPPSGPPGPRAPQPPPAGR